MQSQVCNVVLALRVVHKLEGVRKRKNSTGSCIHAGDPVLTSPSPKKPKVASTLEPVASPQHLASPPAQREPLKGQVFDTVDLSAETDLLANFDPRDAFFVNCKFAAGIREKLLEQAAVVVDLCTADLPLKPMRSYLYTVDELLKCDTEIYQWYKAGMGGSERGRMAAYLHDGCILDALRRHAAGHTVIGIMGGHAMKRADESYEQVAKLCWELARNGFMVVTGGGPGAMEAANLGAFLAKHPKSDIDVALTYLRKGNEEYQFEYQNIKSALAARAALAQENDGEFSLGVPTWHYGHEPPNVFAGRHAKFISNAVREDVLVTMCNGGIVFSQGAAGTRTEIFQFGVPNAYAAETVDNYSKPMIFLGDYWVQSGLFAAVLNVAQREDVDKNRPTGYSSKVYCLHNNDEVISVLEAFRKERQNPHVPTPLPSTVDEALAEPSSRAASELLVKSGMVFGIGAGKGARMTMSAIVALAVSKSWKVSFISCCDLSFAAVSAAAKANPALVTHERLTGTLPVDVTIIEASQHTTSSPFSFAVGDAAADEGCISQQRLLACNSSRLVVVSSSSAYSLEDHPDLKLTLEVLPMAPARVCQFFQNSFTTKGSVPTVRNIEGRYSTPHITDSGNLVVDLCVPHSALSTQGPQELFCSFMSAGGVVGANLYYPIAASYSP